ncbi:UNVERIFIED_CONTAM: Protein transport Sec1a [Sesamum indicum]
MSVSDSETSSHGGDYKTFRQVSRDPCVLRELAREIHSSKYYAVFDLKISLVPKSRESYHTELAWETDPNCLWNESSVDIAACNGLLYEMLQTSKPGDSRSSWKVLIMDKVTVRVMSHSCKMSDITDQGVSLVEDIFRRRQPLPQLDAIYFVQPSKEKAYLYFSTPIQKDLVNRIKKDASVLPRIGALREGFITEHDKALEELYGDDAENSRRFDRCLNVMATRIATVFASLKIAPVIHEWTYDAMCHDLLNLEGNKYVHEVPSKSGGQPERKEVLLEDHDLVWLELRHTHIAEASERLHDKMANFVSKNKAAQLQQRDAGELSTRDIQKMVQALPQYNEQMEKLSLHVAIAGKINQIIRDTGLRELGQLEQDLVFGDAGTKEVINFLRKQEGTNENKLRLMMVYAAVYPEKFEGDKALKLMQKLKSLSAKELSVDDIKI